MSIFDDSDNDKNYIPPSEMKTDLDEFNILEFDIDSVVKLTNNDSILNVPHSDNEPVIENLIDHLCETGNSYNYI